MSKNDAQKPLMAEEATIQERQITVKVLTIGTKQVTQTLFRQLVEEEVIDDDTGNLLGPVWGWVNLHQDCDVKGRHLHVVWEDHGQLKRTTVRPFNSSQKDPVSDRYHHLREELKDTGSIYVSLVALANKGFNHWKSDDHKAFTHINLPLTVKDVSVSVPVPMRVRDFFDAPEKMKQWSKLKEENSNKEYYQREVDYHKKIVSDFLSGDLKKCFDDREWERIRYCEPEQYTSYDDAYKAMEEIVDRMNAIEQNWRQSYKAIEDAGQLFIAVSGVWK